MRKIGNNNVNNDIDNNNKSFVYVLLISFIVCACICFFIIKSGENYDPVLYSEVYDEFEEFEKYITNNSKYNQNIDNSEFGDEYRNSKIIAIITIDKLGLKYPVLKEATAENLNVAPSKFWGSNPNEIGNCCIAGHNFGNTKYFGKLSSLSNGDIVKLMDRSGQNVSYKVYSKNIINESDVKCTSQTTNGKKEITLITCTANSSQRLAVKCIEV